MVTVSGEARCDCLDGYRVVAVMPDGAEIVTDASGTTSADAKAWAKRVSERVEALPVRERLHALLHVDDAIAAADLFLRPCRDCGGRGWLYRLSLAPAAENTVP